MKLNIKGNYCFNQKSFKFIFIFILFVLLFNKFHQNHIFAMNNTDIASSSTSNRSRYSQQSKKLSLSSSSTSFEFLRGLNNKKSHLQNTSFYNILKNLRLDLNKTYHLGVFSLEEIKEKFSDISIDFYLSFEFCGSFPTPEGSLTYTKIYEKQSEPYSVYISLKDFEKNGIYNKLTLVPNDLQKRTIYSYCYDTESYKYTGSNEHTRWNSDNVLDFIVDIEITKSPISNAIPINILFKTYSYTSDNLFFNVGFGIENISFIKK
jgi:hypothetical protein